MRKNKKNKKEMKLALLVKLKQIFGNKKNPSCAAVIVAAGDSTRFQNDKTEINIGGMPALAKAIKAFQESSLISEIVVVTKEEKISHVAELVKTYGFNKVKSVIIGGKTRYESSLAGVSAVSRGIKIIAIHDGARPFVTNAVISRTVEAASKYISAVPAIACEDTLRCFENDYLSGTVERDRIVRIQTPQVFDADLIKGALTFAIKNEIILTDDSSAMDYLGIKTRIVAGDKNNIKLTNPEDIIIAEAIAKKQENEH